jgi:hypothetical protein
MFPSVSGRLRTLATNWTISYRKRYFLLEFREKQFIIHSKLDHAILTKERNNINTCNEELKVSPRKVPILNELGCESLNANSMHAVQ